MTEPQGATPPAQPPHPEGFERIVPRRPSGLADPMPRKPSALSSEQTRESAAKVSASSFWIAMVALLVLAALAFWLLPKLVSAPSPVADAAPTPQATPAPEAQVAPPAPTATPAWDDPALLEARAAAQETQKQYESQLAQLRAQGVERWAADALATVQAQAATAASAFAAKDFMQARSGYEAAVAATSTLLSGIPQRLATALSAGAQALAAGDKTAAQQHYDFALVLDPANAEAKRGLARVANLDAVRAKLDTARRLEQAGDLAGARTAWKEALALDPDTQAARDAIARLDAQAADTEFGRALGDALSALDRGAYDDADRKLARARALRANDPAVQQASARLAEARRGQKLAALEREGSAQLASENWSGAVASFRAAQQLDASLAFAREGLAQAEPRAALAQRIDQTLAAPERLGSAAVMTEATQLLVQARAIANPGPRHLAQTAALERAIAAAATPVDVTLQSDGQTEVTVYRIGALGRFSTHALQLKPGRYTAVGARNGYRDVREDFEVAAGAQNVRVEIRCTEPL